jgi:hypothetical protein
MAAQRNYWMRPGVASVGNVARDPFWVDVHTAIAAGIGRLISQQG